MRTFISFLFTFFWAAAALAQPQGSPAHQDRVPGRGPEWKPMPDPEYVALADRGGFSFGQKINPHGRSFNNAPTFFIYPDEKLDSVRARELLSYFNADTLKKNNFATFFVINPVGEEYDTSKDFEAFVTMFDRARSGNLKVIGIGRGATFVNEAIAPNAGDYIAGILSVGGKAFKGVSGKHYGVPAYVAGSTAAKVVTEYVSLNNAVKSGDHYVNPEEPLLTVYQNSDKNASLAEIFSDAWKKVLGMNFRYNNYLHTHYEGAKYGEYGPYELEPYTDWEALGLKRNVVEFSRIFGGSQPWLWFEYWPEELMEGAPKRSVPVMVLLHGNANDPRTQAETSGFLQVAGKERFFVVEMEWQGSRQYGAMGQDGVEQVIYMLLAKYPQLDPSRVYAEGLSAGSMTATALGIKKSHLFAAVGGHSGGIFGNMGPGSLSGFDGLWAEATQKRGFVEMPYCSVFGTADSTVPFFTKDNYKGNSYLNAWNAYEQLNGLPVIDDLDFSKDPVFGFPLSSRETITTVKGEGIKMETGMIRKDSVPLLKLVAVVDYGHWNFMPTAQVMWDFFKQFSRDVETKKLIYRQK